MDCPLVTGDEAMNRYVMVAALWGLLGPQFQTTGFAQGWPRVVNSAENMEIDYGPNPGNVVGGGIPDQTGQNGVITWLQAPRVQAALPGMVPVLEGSGENSTVVWVPAPAAPASMLAARVEPRG
jgi:hypothetical protein